MVAVDGREWGLECSGAIIDVGEELGEVGQRKANAQNESSKTWTYESWESSCLAKFSDFLGFPTKGFEKEILELLRNLVASQKIDKSEGNLTISKSERELRRLRSTINYNGNKTNKGGGRDRGNLLLKLKMEIKILSWNVRGMNVPDKRKVIKNFLRSHRAYLVCLQETKVQEVNIDMVRSLGVGRCLNWKALNVEGSAGGFLLLWDNSRISLVDYVVGSFYVSCLFRMAKDEFQWTFFEVYGPVEKRLRESF